jgi:hypothetical protein
MMGLYSPLHIFDPSTDTIMQSAKAMRPLFPDLSYRVKKEPESSSQKVPKVGSEELEEGEVLEEEIAKHSESMGASLSKMSVDPSPTLGTSPRSSTPTEYYFGQRVHSAFAIAQKKKKEEPRGFYVGSDRYAFHLGGTKYLIVSKSSTSTTRHPDRIRITDLNPLKKRRVVRMNLQQWVDFVSVFSTIQDIFEEEGEREGSAIDAANNVKRLHIGGNVYVTLKKGVKGVDIRWFWFPHSQTVDYQQAPELFDVEPTRYGIWLSWHEWYTLTTFQEVMKNCVPIEDMKECRPQHHNNRRLLLCSHCNPNGHHTHYH